MRNRLAGVEKPETVTGRDGRVRPTTVGRSSVDPAGRESRADQVVRVVVARGAEGMTVRELCRAIKAHHGVASGALSRLEKQGRLRRDGRLRNGMGIYVTTDNQENR